MNADENVNAKNIGKNYCLLFVYFALIVDNRYTICYTYYIKPCFMIFLTKGMNLIMKCMKCGTENPDGGMFCSNCGEELYTGENVSDKDKTLADSSKDGKKPKKKSFELKSLNTKKKKKPAPKNEELPADGEASSAEPKKKAAKKPFKNPKNIIKLVAALIAAALVAVLAVCIVSWVSGGKGLRIAEKVPIGRNIDYCRKETAEEFPGTSAYPQLKTVASFNYVCEDSKSVNISGIKMPKWAVLVSTGTGNTISQVEYFDFSQLSDGWKGRKSDILLTKDSISYGMDEKTVKKTVGFDPYYIKKTADNRSVYCYRYYIIDNETGSERVYNYFVEFNDVNGTVVNAYDTEINYVNYVLGINN